LDIKPYYTHTLVSEYNGHFHPSSAALVYDPNAVTPSSVVPRDDAMSINIQIQLLVASVTV